MREFPRLCIAGRSLRSRSLANSFSDGLLRVNLYGKELSHPIDLVEPIHVQLAYEAGELET